MEKKAFKWLVKLSRLQDKEMTGLLLCAEKVVIWQKFHCSLHNAKEISFEWSHCIFDKMIHILF